MALTLDKGKLTDDSIEVKLTESTPRPVMLVVRCLKFATTAEVYSRQGTPCGSEPMQDLTDKSLLDDYGLPNVSQLKPPPSSITFPKLEGGSIYVFSAEGYDNNNTPILAVNPLTVQLPKARPALGFDGPVVITMTTTGLKADWKATSDPSPGKISFELISSLAPATEKFTDEAVITQDKADSKHFADSNDGDG